MGPIDVRSERVRPVGPPTRRPTACGRRTIARRDRGYPGDSASPPRWRVGDVIRLPGRRAAIRAVRRALALSVDVPRSQANVYVTCSEIPGKCRDMTFVYLTFVDPISWQMSRHDMTFVFTPISFTISGKCHDMTFVYLTFVDPISWQMSRHDISLNPAEANVATCRGHLLTDISGKCHKDG